MITLLQHVLLAALGDKGSKAKKKGPTQKPSSKLLCTPKIKARIEQRGVEQVPFEEKRCSADALIANAGEKV